MVKGILAIGLALSFAACSASMPDKARLDQDLIEASRQGDEVMVYSLLSAGADINATDAEGWTPYLAASAEGNWKVMKLLQQRGCKTDPGF
jgi:hypothetical protein